MARTHLRLTSNFDTNAGVVKFMAKNTLPVGGINIVDYILEKTDDTVAIEKLLSPLNWRCQYLAIAEINTRIYYGTKAIFTELAKLEGITITANEDANVIVWSLDTNNAKFVHKSNMVVATIPIGMTDLKLDLSDVKSTFVSRAEVTITGSAIATASLSSPETTTVFWNVEVDKQSSKTSIPTTDPAFPAGTDKFSKNPNTATLFNCNAVSLNVVDFV